MRIGVIVRLWRGRFSRRRRMMKRLLCSDCSRFRLLLTLELAVMLPAAILLYVNFRQLHSIKREKKVEATIHRDFIQMLAISEKRINEKAYALTDEVRRLFPSPDTGSDAEKKAALDLILTKRPWLSHVFFFDEDKGILLRTQPQQLTFLRQEHESFSHAFDGWFRLEGKMILEGMHKRSRPYFCYTGTTKRNGVELFMTHAFFALPQSSKNRIVLGGLSFAPDYLKTSFFPEVLEE